MCIEVKKNYNVKKLTSFKIGGDAENLYYPKTQDELIELLSEKTPIVFGSWSNVLVSSAGIKGDVICTSKMEGLNICGKNIKVDAGYKGAKLAQVAAQEGLSGLEFMIGFPGSVGGNIFMNAGAHSQSTCDTLVSVKVFDLESKNVLNLNKEDCEFAYRTSVFQKKNYVILGAEFALQYGDKEQINDIMKTNVEFRKAHQPSLVLPNAGSIFRNPQGDSAGRLLEQVGAKGFSSGGAKVWENHANFIVNANDATSTDVLELMFKMYTEVKNKFEIELKPEVRLVGEFSPREVEICKLMYKQN